MMKITTGVIVCSLAMYNFIIIHFRWTNGIESVAIPTQFYSIAIQCRNKSIDISSCAVEDIQALGIVVYHEENNEVCIKC